MLEQQAIAKRLVQQKDNYGVQLTLTWSQHESESESNMKMRQNIEVAIIRRMIWKADRCHGQKYEITQNMDQRQNH